MFEWLIESKAWEWFFSGAGVVLGGWLITRSRRKKLHESKDTERHTNVEKSQVAVIGDHPKIEGGIHFHNDRADPKNLRLQYLTDLAKDANILPWASVDPDHADPKRGESLGLADIYTALDTTKTERLESEDAVREYLRHQHEERRISAQEMADRESRLVLLGDPGSGKSTLVNYLAYVMAQAGRDGDPQAWLDRLEKPGPWKHRMLLPIRVILREFAATLDPSAGNGKSDKLLSFLKDSLKPAEFWPVLYEELLEPKTPYLILLDGLDEVPAGLRQAVVGIISDFSEKYKAHRYIVTCRIYAYVGQKYQLGGFHQATLMPFNREQIENFVSAWYHELSQRGRFNEKEADARAERLRHAATRPDLLGLAERPLLLTVMALLHTFRGQLPDDRVELYQWTVDLLLRRWEGRSGNEAGIIETLGIPDLRMSDLEAGLYDVAYHAHARHGGEGDTADIREADLRERLAPYLNEDWNKAGAFVCYVRERAGLLIRHKTDAYTFPHRTFQEFMAACHLVAMSDYPAESARLIETDADRWRIVFILAAGHAARTHRLGQAIASVNALCPEGVSEVSPDADAFHTAEIAAEALLEIGLVGVRRDKVGKVLLGRMRDWLLAAMRADEILKPQERTEAGNLLAKLGDPRFDPEMFFLPKDEELGFVRIPAGEFLMGSDEKQDKEASDWELPQHPVELSEYYMARYPVTVAQFRVFTQETGHHTDEDWEQYNTHDNHPVVKVSWEDAVAYCEWLTERLKDKGFEWQVCLPTEAQWEMAARGNDGRIYPWGEEADTNKANYKDTKIGTTSAVGCFPRGESPYRGADMAGNVWEWCHDWHDDYPSSRVVNPTGPETGSYRVDRGGSWFTNARRCRSANRSYDHPAIRNNSVGFRLSREAP